MNFIDNKNEIKLNILIQKDEKKCANNRFLNLNFFLIKI